MMSCIRAKDTKPELLVRRMLHKRGFRYTLHAGKLPGKPDMVFPSLKAVIFVHGCFWHGHEGCHYFRWPTSRKEFWQEKIGRNKYNDDRSSRALAYEGWRILTVWECSLRGKDAATREEIGNRIADWLENGKRSKQIKGFPDAHR